MITAVLTAGGTGSRMKNNIPKQFITVNEIPIIVYTLQKFQNNKNVDRIIIACLKEWQPVLAAYAKEFHISKLEKVVDGGATGIESIQNCFKVLGEQQEDDLVMIHDGNRPLVDDDTIERNIEAANKAGATTTYVDIHDGIVKVDDSLRIQESGFKREYIKSTQTPHCFKHKIIESIFSKMHNGEEYISLADAAVNMGYEVALVKGSEINFKITTSNDKDLFESIINTRHDNV